MKVDETSNSMVVWARLSLQTGRNTTSLIFRLRPAMTVRSVAEEGAGPLQFTKPFWDFYNVSLGRELEAGTALNLTVSYDGPVLNTPDGGGSYWDYVGPEGSWVRCYGGYFPADENWSRTPFRLSMTAPANRTVVCSGGLLGRTEDPANGTATTVWDDGLPAIGISFMAGNLTRTGFDLGGHRYEVYFRPDHAGSAASYAAEMQRAAGFYTAQFGEPGFRNLSVAEVPSLYAAWGQSLPSMMWLSSRNFDGALPYRLISHEMAHQWWGIDVEGYGAAENFLQEGFAGYSEAMYEMAFYASRGYLDFCRQQYISRFVNGPVPEPSLVSNDYDLASYKGPWVLHMLRFLVGDDAFNRTLLSFHKDRSGGRADHSDFEDVVRSTTGRDLSVFFLMWLYSSGRLDYAVADAVVLRGIAGTDRVRVVVESRGVLGDMPLDLGLYFEGGRWGLAGAAWNGSGPNTTLEQDVNHPVDAVRLDPQNWLLDAYPSNNEAPTRDGFQDISLDSIGFSNDSPLENESFTITAMLACNTTEGPLEVGLGLLVGGAPAGNATVSVNPAGRVAANFTLALVAGEHPVTVVADPHGALYERDESNNRATGRITVRPRPPVLPELGILPGGIAVRPDGIAGGRPAAIEVLVVNSGAATASGAVVDVWVDDPATGYVGRSRAFSSAPSVTVASAVPWTAVSGWHQLTARVSLPQGQNDSDPGNDEATTQVYVNAPPSAALSAQPAQARPGEWVDFSGALSVDDTRVSYYRFDFGDGEDTGWLAENSTAHAYQAKGTYQALLLVLDDTGAASDWSAPVVVRVSSSPPAAAIRAARRTADVLTPLRFYSASSDPDGSVTTLTWSFGDGGTASGVRVDHTFARKGDFTVTLTAADDDGLSSSATLRVRIEDLPPLPKIYCSGTQARVGQRVYFGAANTTDPDDQATAMTYVWDFGGGQKATGPEASYAFAGPGWHRVMLTASDGNLSAASWVDIEVRATPPAEAPPDAGLLAWALLGLLLLTMAAAAAYAIFPINPRTDEEEE